MKKQIHQVVSSSDLIQGSALKANSRFRGNDKERNDTHRNGFTLLELLVVIAIIAIFISVATVSYSSAQRKSRDSRRKTDLKAVQAALEQYSADNGGNYLVGCTPGASYLPNGMPSDPKTGVTYTGTNFGASCTTTTSYCICAQLESEVNSQTGCDGTTPDTGYTGAFCIHNLQ